jgi:hypothetical protein
MHSNSAIVAAMNTYPDPKPISEHPHDDEAVLVFFPEWGWMRGWYNCGRWNAEGVDRDLPAPTHYLPLPPDPQ